MADSYFLHDIHVYALPFTHPSAHLYRVTVKERNDGMWWVQDPFGELITKDARRVEEFVARSNPNWRAENCFMTKEEALAAAERYVHSFRMNNLSAADAGRIQDMSEAEFLQFREEMKARKDEIRDEYLATVVLNSEVEGKG